MRQQACRKLDAFDACKLTQPAAAAKVIPRSVSRKRSCHASGSPYRRKGLVAKCAGAQAAAPEPHKRRVFLSAPNLVGYVRLALLGAACAHHGTKPEAALWLASSSLLLDALDGFLARVLDQATAFGAWLDVATDVVTRGFLWVWACPTLGFAVPALEALVFVCTHAVGGAAWKTGCFAGAPPWVAAVCANGFYTPWGAAAMGGLFGLPAALYAVRCCGAAWIPQGLLWALAAGRGLCASVEVWVLGSYVRALARQTP